MLLIGSLSWVRLYRIMEASDCRIFRQPCQINTSIGELGHKACL